MMKSFLLVAAIAAVLCASTATTAAASSPVELSDWMAALRPIIANQTLLDLSLPGTHDSMTWDLSTTIADNANDLPPELAWLLHDLHDVASVGDFIRNQSKTQGLNVTQQLDAGIRFIDFRIVYSAAPSGSSSKQHAWYCLHMMQTNSLAMQYLQQAKEWMLQHPEELVVFWLSRHGGPCSTTYPDTTLDDMRSFWVSIESLFSGMMFDRTVDSVNETTVDQLLARNHRAIMYVSDYQNFTAGSDFAIDGCTIDNKLGDEITSEPNSLPLLYKQMQDALTVRAADKAAGRFYLHSMAAGNPRKQLEYAALLRYLPLDRSKYEAECAALFNIPGMTNWCPLHLQDVSQMTNYYNQIVLDAVITHNLSLPNAIYLDAVDTGGLIRTGTQLFGQNYPTGSTGPHATTGFAYAYTFIMYNVRYTCNNMATRAPECDELLSELASLRAKNPLTTWSDPEHGRLVNWPIIPVPQ